MGVAPAGTMTMTLEPSSRATTAAPVTATFTRRHDYDRQLPDWTCRKDGVSGGRMRICAQIWGPPNSVPGPSPGPSYFRPRVRPRVRPYSVPLPSWTGTSSPVPGRELAISFPGRAVAELEERSLPARQPFARHRRGSLRASSR